MSKTKGVLSRDGGERASANGKIYLFIESRATLFVSDPRRAQLWHANHTVVTATVPENIHSLISQ